MAAKIVDWFEEAGAPGVIAGVGAVILAISAATSSG
jgi:hypothetical protein